MGFDNDAVRLALDNDGGDHPELVDAAAAVVVERDLTREMGDAGGHPSFSTWLVP